MHSTLSLPHNNLHSRYTFRTISRHLISHELRQCQIELYIRIVDPNSDIFPLSRPTEGEFLARLKRAWLGILTLTQVMQLIEDDCPQCDDGWILDWKMLLLN